METSEKVTAEIDVNDQTIAKILHFKDVKIYRSFEGPCYFASWNQSTGYVFIGECRMGCLAELNPDLDMVVFRRFLSEAEKIMREIGKDPSAIIQPFNQP